jgi:hypothetical protein
MGRAVAMPTVGRKRNRDWVCRRRAGVQRDIINRSSKLWDISPVSVRATLELSLKLKSDLQKCLNFGANELT